MLLYDGRGAVDVSLDSVDLLSELSKKIAAFQQHGFVLLKDAVDLTALSQFKLLKGLFFGWRRAGQRWQIFQRKG